MVTVSGNTVTTSSEFTALATQLSGVTTIDTPAQGSGTTPALPACPSVDANWLGSSEVSRCPKFVSNMLTTSPSFRRLPTRPSATASGLTRHVFSLLRQTTRLLSSRSSSRRHARTLEPAAGPALLSVKTERLVPTDRLVPAMEVGCSMVVIVSRSLIISCSHEALLDLLSVLLGHE